MGRPRKYTAKRLREQVERYFDSISRVVPVLVPENTGNLDKFGHEIVKMVPAQNRLGEQIMHTEYLIPPSVGGLCEFLGIHRDTWAEYCDKTKHPEFSDTTTYAQGCIHAYLEQELLTRSGKDLKGVQFNLENNYGYKEQVAMEHSGTTLEDFIAGKEQSF